MVDLTIHRPRLFSRTQSWELRGSWGSPSHLPNSLPGVPQDSSLRLPVDHHFRRSLCRTLCRLSSFIYQVEHPPHPPYGSGVPDGCGKRRLAVTRDSPRSLGWWFRWRLKSCRTIGLWSTTNLHVKDLRLKRNKNSSPPVYSGEGR